MRGLLALVDEARAQLAASDTPSDAVTVLAGEVERLRRVARTLYDALADVMRYDDLCHPCDHEPDPDCCSHCCARYALTTCALIVNPMTTDGGGTDGRGVFRAHGATDRSHAGSADRGRARRAGAGTGRRVIL